MNIILLSGGSGKRLWPLSNDIRSKQFIKIFKKENGEVLIADIHDKDLFSSIQRITDASVRKKEKIVLLNRTNNRLISNIYDDNYYKKDTAIEKLRKDLSKDLSYDERKYILFVSQFCSV